MQWDNASTNSYRMGKEGKYDLKLAETPMMSDSDTEAEEETVEDEITALGDTGAAAWNTEVSERLMRTMIIMTVSRCLIRVR